MDFYGGNYLPEELMVLLSNFGYDSMGIPTCLRKQEVGKPSLNAAHPYAMAEGCVRRRGGWMWRVFRKLGGEVVGVGSLVL